VLDILNKYGITGTFFVQGSAAHHDPAMVRAVFEAGNAIGNHTYSHVRPRSISLGEFRSQVNRTNNAIFDAIGVYPTLFRPPYGSSLKGRTSALGDLRVFRWNVDTLDWQHSATNSKVLARVTSGTAKLEKAAEKKGEDEVHVIILMHDKHHHGLEEVILYLISQGYTFDTLDNYPAE
jgi:peptidoglycan/xylan/chitin deacetylase (PgdA/CDA1 family)